jgi:hypothetical protein
MPSADTDFPSGLIDLNDGSRFSFDHVKATGNVSEADYRAD